MSKTALLIMDVQRGIVERLGDAAKAYLAGIEQAADHARAQHIPVIFVTVAFREGAPEISPRNKSFSALKTQGGLLESSDNTDIMAPLQAGDIHVTKRRVSAFTGSDLEVVLRGLEASDLVLAGIATSGVVLSTLREAADKDYGLTVLADGCHDADPEVHRVLTEKVFPRQAEVITVREWIGT